MGRKGSAGKVKATPVKASKAKRDPSSVKPFYRGSK
jgi:hypothetical protein